MVFAGFDPSQMDYEMLRSGLRILVMGGLVLSLAACDKCGDYLKINAPSIPKSCADSAPAQK